MNERRDQPVEDLRQLEDLSTQLAERVEELSLQLERCIEENADLRMRMQVIQGLNTLNSSQATRESYPASNRDDNPGGSRYETRKKTEQVPKEIQNLEVPNMPFHHPDPDPEPPTREAALTSQKEEMEAMKASRAEREEALTTQLEAMSQETQDLRHQLLLLEQSGQLQQQQATPTVAQKKPHGKASEKRLPASGKVSFRMEKDDSRVTAALAKNSSLLWVRSLLRELLHGHKAVLFHRWASAYRHSCRQEEIDVTATMLSRLQSEKEAAESSREQLEALLGGEREKCRSLEQELATARERLGKFQELLEVEQKNVTTMATKLVTLQTQNVQIVMEKISMEETVHQHKVCYCTCTHV